MEEMEVTGEILGRGEDRDAVEARVAELNAQGVA